MIPTKPDKFVPPNRRWWLITLISMLSLFQAMTVIYFLRLPQTVRDVVIIPWWGQVMVSVGWTLIFAITVVSLFRRTPKVEKRAFWLVSGFILYSILRLVLFTQANYDRQRLPFMLLMVMLIMGMLWLLRVVILRIRDIVMAWGARTDIEQTMELGSYD